MRNGLNLLGIDPNWQYIATGTVIVVAVELDVIRGHLESRFRSLQASDRMTVTRPRRAPVLEVREATQAVRRRRGAGRCDVRRRTPARCWRCWATTARASPP